MLDRKLCAETGSTVASNGAQCFLQAIVEHMYSCLIAISLYGEAIEQPRHYEGSEQTMTHICIGSTSCTMYGTEHTVHFLHTDSTCALHDRVSMCSTPSWRMEATRSRGSADRWRTERQDVAGLALHVDCLSTGNITSHLFL